MTEIYELVCKRCDKDSDASDYNHMLYKNGCVVCCERCATPSAVKRVRKQNTQSVSQYRLVMDKLHEFDNWAADNAKNQKEQKLAYIAELSNSVSDVQCRLESASHVYMLQYLDDETALITKHLPVPANPDLVGYYVAKKDKLGKHIDTQYNRYRGRANIGALTKAMHDMLTNLAMLKVMEYLTNDNH